jgi:hypothetical protein
MNIIAIRTNAGWYKRNNSKAGYEQQNYNQKSLYPGLSLAPERRWLIGGYNIAIQSARASICFFVQLPTGVLY